MCSELLDREIERILLTPASSKPRKLRCAGVYFLPHLVHFQCAFMVDQKDYMSHTFIKYITWIIVSRCGTRVIKHVKAI